MSVIAPGRNIVLFGMMGAGKTEVGHVVATRLRRPFWDTDDIVEREAGMTVAGIFAERGERAFRRHEAEAVRHVAALRGRVVAVGGGAVLDPDNTTQLRATGDLVWLDAGPAELAERVGDHAGDRPLLGSGDAAGLRERLRRLAERREQAYARAADHRIDTSGRSPGEVASALIAWARTRPGLLAPDEREDDPA
ncbi:hypothetical protein BH20ACT9_BH20ACT9_10760 [soil metagenome]